MLAMRSAPSLLPLLILLCMLLWCPSMNGATPAQGTQIQPQSLAAAVAGVNKGNWADIEHVIAIAGPTQGTPILQDLFRNSQDTETKERIASYLYRLGDREDIYWSFILNQATLAVESDAPFPHPYDTKGKMEDQFSPGFAAWATTHGMSTDAAVKAEWDRYNKILILAVTNDPRAIPVLRRGLNSPDELIESISAKGLAQLHDTDSIPLIVAACQRAPADAATLIGEALIYYDDPEAQAAAETYLPKAKFGAIREQIRIYGDGPLIPMPRH